MQQKGESPIRHSPLLSPRLRRSRLPGYPALGRLPLRLPRLQHAHGAGEFVVGDLVLLVGDAQLGLGEASDGMVDRGCQPQLGRVHFLGGAPARHLLLGGGLLAHQLGAFGIQQAVIAVEAFHAGLHEIHVVLRAVNTRLGGLGAAARGGFHAEHAEPAQAAKQPLVRGQAGLGGAGSFLGAVAQCMNGSKMCLKTINPDSCDRLATWYFRNEAKLLGATVNRGRPKLPRIQPSLFVIRHGEEEMRPEIEIGRERKPTAIQPCMRRLMDDQWCNDVGALLADKPAIQLAEVEGRIEPPSIA